MAQVTKETMLGELLNINIDAAAPVLLGIGMHGLGCPASQMETIEEAAAVHGVEADELVKALNEKLAEACDGRYEQKSCSRKRRSKKRLEYRHSNKRGGQWR